METPVGTPVETPVETLVCSRCPWCTGFHSRGRARDNSRPRKENIGTGQCQRRPTKGLIERYGRSGLKFTVKAPRKP